MKSKLSAGKGSAVAAQEPSTDAEHRRRPGDEQQIAGTAPRHVDQQRLQRIAARHLRRRPGRAFPLHRRLAFIELADELFQFGIGDQSSHASEYERIMPEVTDTPSSDVSMVERLAANFAKLWSAVATEPPLWEGGVR